MLVLEGLIGLHRTIQLHLLQLIGWSIDLDHCDIEWFALETDIILSFLRLHPSAAFRTLLLTMMGTPFLLRDYFSINVK